MNPIKASSLKAAIHLTALLKINDGRYDQWQALFLKELNRASRFKYSAKWMKPTKSGSDIYHGLRIDKEGYNGGSVILFEETATGYVYVCTQSLNQNVPANSKTLLPNDKLAYTWPDSAAMKSGANIIDKLLTSYGEKPRQKVGPNAQTYALIFHTILTDPTASTPVPSGMQRKTVVPKDSRSHGVLIGVKVQQFNSEEEAVAAAKAYYPAANKLFDSENNDGFRNMREYLSMDVLNLDTDKPVLQSGDKELSAGWGTVPLNKASLKKLGFKLEV